MKKLAILFMFVFVLPVYPQNQIHFHNIYDIDTSKDTLEINGKMYIHTPQYDTLVIDDYRMGTKWDSSGWITMGVIGYYNYPQKYLILEDIKNSCICGNEKTFNPNPNLIDEYIYQVIMTEKYRLEIQICEDCGNIYVARKQVLKSIK